LQSNQNITPTEAQIIKPQSPSDYLTIKQGAEYKGIHTNTIRNLILSGRLKAERMGRRVVRFKRGDLDACFTEYKGGEFGKYAN
jgi:excisionase family DNA binding protein